MHNLAGTLRSQGDLAGARALQEQALAVRRRVLGVEHPDTLTSMSNLAETLRSQGDLAGARALEEQVLAVRRRVLGEEHPVTLGS
ncbi:MAG: tetratricopeptide repeat protein, partial [Alphaproteobacteria bacterium]